MTYHILEVQIREVFLMDVLALSLGVDGVTTRVWLEGIYKRISV